MPRKGENIHKRVDGRWEARVLIDCRYKSIYGHSYSEVKEKKRLIENGCLTTKKDVQFIDASKQWLNHIQYNVKQSTYARYVYLLNTYIFKKFKNITISKINSSYINKYSYYLLNEGSIRSNKGLSNKTVCDILSLIKNIINYHYSLLGINTNSINFDYPKLVINKINILSNIDINNIKQYIFKENKTYMIGILLSIYLGLRIGEVCALTWPDINLQNMTIHISKTMQRVNQNKHSKVIIDKPKTISSDRILPIPNCLIEYLRKYKQVNDSYLLTGSNKYMEPRVYYNKYKKVLRLCNIKDYNYHALRHTFATKCIESGMDAKTLSELLGHSSVNVTLRLYVHPTMAMKRKAINKFQSII